MPEFERVEKMSDSNNSAGQTQCANCGASSSTAFCGECGQDQKQATLSVGLWLKEIFQELFSVDSRFLVSLRLLLFSPGKLGSEWQLGRRKKYISPTRLYIISASLFFLISALVPNSQENVLLEIAHGWTEADTQAPETREEIKPNKNILKKVSDWSTASIKWLMMFGMVPVLAVLTKLFIGFRKEYFASHLVSSLHVHSFLFILMALLVLTLNFSTKGASTSMVENVAYISVIAITFIYIVILFRRTFKRSWFATIALSCMIYLTYVILLSGVGIMMILWAEDIV